MQSSAFYLVSASEIIWPLLRMVVTELFIKCSAQFDSDDRIFVCSHLMNARQG